MPSEVWRLRGQQFRGPERGEHGHCQTPWRQGMFRFSTPPEETHSRGQSPFWTDEEAGRIGSGASSCWAGAGIACEIETQDQRTRTGQLEARNKTNMRAPDETVVCSAQPATASAGQACSAKRARQPSSRRRNKQRQPIYAAGCGRELAAVEMGSRLDGFRACIAGSVFQDAWRAANHDGAPPPVPPAESRSVAGQSIRRGAGQRVWLRNQAGSEARVSYWPPGFRVVICVLCVGVGRCARSDSLAGVDGLAAGGVTGAGMGGSTGVGVLSI